MLLRSSALPNSADLTIVVSAACILRCIESVSKTKAAMAVVTVVPEATTEAVKIATVAAAVAGAELNQCVPV
jgi:hypothetical protein